MKKVTALLVSGSLMMFNFTPAQANGTTKLVRGVKALTSSGSKQFFTPRLNSRLQIPVVSNRINPTFSANIINVENAHQPVAAIANKPTSQQISSQIDRLAFKALQERAQGFTLAQIRERIAQKNTAGLAQRILSYPNQNVREGMLRNEFVQVALDGNASAEQIQQAADFWRSDLKTALESFSALPTGNLNTLLAAFKQKDASVIQVNAALADVAALGLYGTAQDAALILAFYRRAADTPFASLAATAAARALLRLNAKTELEQLYRLSAANSSVWEGIGSYANQMGIGISSPSRISSESENNVFLPALNTYGRLNLLAADPSKKATNLYIRLGRPGVRKISNPMTVQALPTETLPQPKISLSSVSPQTKPVTSDAAGEVGSVITPTNLYIRLGRPGVRKISNQFAASAQAAPRPIVEQTQSPAKSSFSFFSRSEKPTASISRAGMLYGGFPLPAVWENVKKIATALKSVLSPKAASIKRPALRPEEAPASGLVGVLQRGSLYLASFVMGLEVATPVIANFGTSFGLSLSDNILVASATYFPYSVGAFLSNWLKEKIGRKASMNLGLGLMGGGFLAGVSLFGLNGSFVPEADTMAHFYKILACITTASMGGVFVHNAVGPMMTDLSAGASELTLQKRNANTELSRALGMAASFAFPFLSTKVLGMDWSFTFALPIPLVAAAALGINIAKIPNSKPILEPKPIPTPTAMGVGKRNRRAYQLSSSLLNNSYIRLFKEEKGVLALLTGLMTMNAVEMSYSNGFLFLLPELTKDPSSQYLFGLVQFALPFLIGRYLAKGFLQWFPKNNMSLATALAGLGGLVALPLAGNVYALTAALFAAEVGISTTFTLAFARSAKNIRTQDRIVSLIVASAISCAFGPMLLTQLAEKLMSLGLVFSDATVYSMIGASSVLSLISAALFKRTERLQTAAAEGTPTNIQKTVFKQNRMKKLFDRLFGKHKK